MIGISSLDLLAFPHRRSDRVVVPVVDARKGEVFYAMYRQVPGGLQQVVAPRVGPVDELVADLLARSQEALCVGDGALRYRAEILDGFHCEIADEAHPSAGPLVQLAHARALREEWVSPAEIQPVYLRQPDAQINWVDRDGATMRAQAHERARPVPRARRRRAGDDRADAPPPRRPDPGDRAGVVPAAVDAHGVPRRARPGRAPVTATTSSPAAGAASSATAG